MGHGSTENPDSSTPYFDHAAEILKRGLFAEVYCCFWREGPSMRAALYMIGAEEVAPGVLPEACTLFIVGHGTGLNKSSTKAIRDQVELIQTLPENRFASVEDTDMEEAPLISEWDQLAETPNFIVVPFFIADGLQPLRCPSPKKIEKRNLKRKLKVLQSRYPYKKPQMVGRYAPARR